MDQVKLGQITKERDARGLTKDEGESTFTQIKGTDVRIIEALSVVVSRLNEHEGAIKLLADNIIHRQSSRKKIYPVGLKIPNAPGRQRSMEQLVPQTNPPLLWLTMQMLQQSLILRRGLR